MAHGSGSVNSTKAYNPNPTLHPSLARIDAAAAVATKTIPQAIPVENRAIPQSLDQYERILGRLHEQLGRLIEKTAGIVPGPGGDPNAGLAPEGGSPIAHRFADLNSRLLTASNIVESLVDRLEL